MVTIHRSMPPPPPPADILGDRKAPPSTGLLVIQGIRLRDEVQSSDFEAESAFGLQAIKVGCRSAEKGLLKQRSTWLFSAWK